MPGDTIWLRGGTYGRGGAAVFTCTLKGTAASPITIRQRSGERATVDGSISVTGQYTIFWGFEITNSSVVRKTENKNRPAGLNLLGRGHKVVNMIIHDTGHPGIGYWTPVGDGGEIYGTLIWGCGLYDLSDPRFPDGWTRGSAIYAQNKDGTRYIREVISFRNFTTGMKAYTEGSYADGFHLEGNVAFDNGEYNIFSASKNNPQQRLKLLNNYTWRFADDSDKSVHIGYYDRDNLDALVKDNYFVSGISAGFMAKRWRNLTFTGNTVVSRGPASDWVKPAGAASNLWDANQYFSAFAKPFNFNGAVTFADWMTGTQFDSASKLQAGLPSGIKVFVRPNAYDSDRAHIIVYNWDKASAVTVDVAPILKKRDRFELRDAQNYFGAPVLSGTYDDQPLNVPMSLKDAVPLIGPTHITTRHTAPEFGAFILIRVSRGIAAD